VLHIKDRIGLELRKKAVIATAFLFKIL